jgi:hypothetical protein
LLAYRPAPRDEADEPSPKAAYSPSGTGITYKRGF